MPAALVLALKSLLRSGEWDLVVDNHAAHNLDNPDRIRIEPAAFAGGGQQVGEIQSDFGRLVVPLVAGGLHRDRHAKPP